MLVGIVVGVFIPEMITVSVPELCRLKNLVTSSGIKGTYRRYDRRKYDDARNERNYTGVHMVQNKKLVSEWIWCHCTYSRSLDWIRSVFPLLASFWHILCFPRYIGTMYILWSYFRDRNRLWWILTSCNDNLLILWLFNRRNWCNYFCL